MLPLISWLKIGAAVIALGGAFGAGFWLEDTIKSKTILTMQRDAATAIVKAQAQAAAKQLGADQITDAINVANAKAEAVANQKTITLIRKVPGYVPPKVDATFPLSCGWLRVHDAAARAVDPSTIPLPTGRSDTDICPVAASTAASVIAGNYALALGWRQDAITWANWYQQQVNNWNK